LITREPAGREGPLSGPLSATVLLRRIVHRPPAPVAILRAASFPIVAPAIVVRSRTATAGFVLPPAFLPLAWTSRAIATGLFAERLAVRALALRRVPIAPVGSRGFLVERPAVVPLTRVLRSTLRPGAEVPRPIVAAWVVATWIVVTWIVVTWFVVTGAFMRPVPRIAVAARVAAERIPVRLLAWCGIVTPPAAVLAFELLLSAILVPRLLGILEWLSRVAVLAARTPVAAARALTAFGMFAPAGLTRALTIAMIATI
jgi:hypothetical protein